MSRTIPAIADPTSRVIPKPAAAAPPAGLVRVPFSMAWMTASRDAGNLLTGTVTDDGAGTISVPHIAMAGFSTTRTGSAIFTAPLSVLATALGVTEADIKLGDVGIEVICSELAIKKRVSVNFLLADRDASAQNTNRALACGAGNKTTTANKFSATATKSNTSGSTASVVDTNSWTQWLIRSNKVTTENFVGGGTLWQLDNDGDPIPFSNTIFKELNTAIAPTHFGLLVCAEGSSGESGTSTLKMTIVARTNEDATGIPG